MTPGILAMIGTDVNFTHHIQSKERTVNDFHQTAMGRTFYEHTMPSTVRQLAELTIAVKELAELVQNGLEADKERLAKTTKDVNGKRDW